MGSKEKKGRKNSTSSGAATAKKYEALQNSIFQFVERNNLYVILTDMMNKAFLNNEPDAILFMIKYLLEIKESTLEEHYVKECADWKMKYYAVTNQFAEVSIENEQLRNQIDAINRQKSKIYEKPNDKFIEKVFAPMISIPSDVYDTVLAGKSITDPLPLVSIEVKSESENETDYVEKVLMGELEKDEDLCAQKNLDLSEDSEMDLEPEIDTSNNITIAQQKELTTFIQLSNDNSKLQTDEKKTAEPAIGEVLQQETVIDEVLRQETVIGEVLQQEICDRSEENSIKVSDTKEVQSISDDKESKITQPDSLSKLVSSIIEDDSDLSDASMVIDEDIKSNSEVEEESHRLKTIESSSKISPEKPEENLNPQEIEKSLEFFVETDNNKTTDYDMIEKQLEAMQEGSLEATKASNNNSLPLLSDDSILNSSDTPMISKTENLPKSTKEDEDFEPNYELDSD
ncbi:CLUMA_CG017957, isoform A [Clunio marinus]|uniref:CLUMA_CG017957, isoform A n=1 Tax=Clunio marinus TaxID=568069 RepID=A0A1J1IY19_9DIPT|nr:CLUMA_CG017957, isoform A [Clunio marinus]